MADVTPRKLEPFFLYSFAALFLVGLFSFGMSAYNGNGREDLAQNFIWTGLVVLIVIVAYFMQRNSVGK